ncbi:hypothetical protein [Blastococcus goldschmidtiae]|uniref:DUF4386 family protein n=1 Tax=Blastococcus goldschmidtiae TaxID=3075546 RepID=A0ABU2KDM7_9ACTN|nr:hypothetical protein [Blastococcus sp. DSM 46792]MDT0278279.1 hypothetical protein [Blastococcus sp. DSM 46792]
MSTAAVTDVLVPPTHRGSPLPALAGVGGVAAFASAAVVFGDPLAGSGDPAEAAEQLAGSSATLAGLLVGVYAVLAVAVTGALAGRLARAGESAAVRLLPVLGFGHVILLAIAFAAPAAAVSVGTQVFDDGVSPTGTEAALVLMNVAHPMSAWLGVGFLVAVVLGGRAAQVSRALVAISAVFAVGLLLPPVGWAVTYLMAFWFAGVGIWLWRRA